MPTLPHDLNDLALAPMLLHLDRELASYAGLNVEEMRLRLAAETNQEPHFGPARKACVLEAITRFVDLRGWQPTWTNRGLRLANHSHSVTLGLPPNLASFLELS
jgi:hypothetical protein